MKGADLQLDNAPPLIVSLRFFLIAPLFGLLAAAIVLVEGGAALLSRWQLPLLSAVHALVLGCYASVMFGALQQMLPVVAGVTVAKPRRMSALTFAFWVPGVLVLLGAFMHPAPWLFTAAAALLSAAVVYFLAACGRALWGNVSRSQSVPGMVLAMLALVVTLVLGIWLALGHAGWWPLARPVGTDSHMSWGLLGWIAILIAGIAWQVVPMFQITPDYPRWVRRAVPAGLFVALLVRGAGSVGAWNGLILLADVAVSLLLALFAGQTLWLQHRRLRKIHDAHGQFWSWGMINLLAAIALWWWGEFASAELGANLQLTATTVFLLGFVLAVVTGMLYKIIPFLLWLQLQTRRREALASGEQAPPAPNMKKILPARWGRWQLAWLLAAELLLIAALWWPLLARPAALLWGGFFGWLLGAMLAAGKVLR